MKYIVLSDNSVGKYYLIEFVQLEGGNGVFWRYSGESRLYITPFKYLNSNYDYTEFIKSLGYTLIGRVL